MVITKNTLKELHKKQLFNKNLASKPKRMFVNGTFNKNNWNGGDDIIRDFLSDIENRQIPNSYVVDMDDYEEILIAHVDRVDDSTYSTILFDENVYLFGWYKSRGCTDLAKKNGQPLTEDEYIELLNVISKTDYVFHI